MISISGQSSRSETDERRASKKARVQKTVLGLAHEGHGGASCGGGGNRGAFAVEVHEVGQNRLVTELAKESCDLAAVIGAMIGQVLHGLPERIFVHAEIEGLVFEDAIEICLCDARGEDQQFFCVGPPIFTECCDRLRGGGVGESRRRAALKAL